MDKPPPPPPPDAAPAPSTATTTTPPPLLKRTFYRRRLPSTSISFSSPEGRAVFASAMANGGTRSFFPLIEQLQTQPEPAYCGLTTLVIVLNALAVDPRRSWKGPWRWYEESMLNCCVDLEEVKRTGVTFATVACLAKCQGLDVDAVRASTSTVDEFRRVVGRACAAPPSDRTRPASFLIVSYARGAVGQTGGGHFSPVGAYDEASDLVLVLDTARFKYGPHWLPLPLLFDALLPPDPVTGGSRGYMVLGYDGEDGDGAGDETRPSRLPLSVIFKSKKSKDYIRREYKQYLQDRRERSGKDVTLASVVEFWTKNGTDNNRVWELVQPQLQPVDSCDIQMVESVRCLVKSLMEANEHASSIPPIVRSTRGGTLPAAGCCNQSASDSMERAIDISPAEVLCLVYLASLPPGARHVVVRASERVGDAGSGTDVAAGDQVLAEAALISYAIETCDADE